jgi:hypothetical protein
MPLPFAPPPKDSKVYRDLKNIKVSGVTADQIDTLKDELFAQGVDGSEDEMRRLLLLGQVSNQASNSGPIPDTLAITQIVADTSGTKAGNIKIASAGEVWQLNGRSGSCTHEVFLRDTVNSRDCEIIDVSASSSQLPLHENNWMGPVYVDENISIMYEVTGTFTDSTLQFVAARVR